MIKKFTVFALRAVVATPEVKSLDENGLADYAVAESAAPVYFTREKQASELKEKLEHFGLVVHVAREQREVEI